jgi:hypothetical protein
MNVYNARVNVINLTPVSHQNHSPQTSRAMRIALGMIINIRLDLVYSHTQRTKCVEQMSLHITKAVLTSAQQRKKNVPAPNVKSQTTLISTGQTGERSRSVKDRKRNPRLNGADIYIARLGYRRDDASSPSVVCSGPGHDSPERSRRQSKSLLSHQDLAIDASLTWLQLASDELSGLLKMACGRALKLAISWTV